MKPYIKPESEELLKEDVGTDPVKDRKETTYVLAIVCLCAHMGLVDNL